MAGDCFDGMTFHYGDFAHQPGEVYPKKIEIRPEFMKYSGVKHTSTFRMSVGGELLSLDNNPLTPPDITERINDIAGAYSEDFKDCGFKTSDGVKTAHWLTNDDQWNLSGNRVTFRSWDTTPESLITEYANTRSFSITVEAVFQTSQLQIVEFKEQVVKTGTGGPIFKTYTTWDGSPVVEPISRYSHVKHVQQGYIVAMNQHVLPPPPYWPYEEQGWLRQVSFSSPRWYGDPKFEKAILYRTDYKYFFERPGPSALTQQDWYFG